MSSDTVDTLLGLLGYLSTSPGVSWLLEGTPTSSFELVTYLDRRKDVHVSFNKAEVHALLSKGKEELPRLIATARSEDLKELLTRLLEKV